MLHRQVVVVVCGDGEMPMGCCRRLDQSSVRQPGLPLARPADRLSAGRAVSIGVARTRPGGAAVCAGARRPCNAIVVTLVIAARPPFCDSVVVTLSLRRAGRPRSLIVANWSRLRRAPWRSAVSDERDLIYDISDVRTDFRYRRASSS